MKLLYVFHALLQIQIEVSLQFDDVSFEIRYFLYVALLDFLRDQVHHAAELHLLFLRGQLKRLIHIFQTRLIGLGRLLDFVEKDSLLLS